MAISGGGADHDGPPVPDIRVGADRSDYGDRAAAVLFPRAGGGGAVHRLFRGRRCGDPLSGEARPRYDDLSLAANETVLVFGLVNVGLGMLWAKPIWGIWWTWDPRLTSSFLLLFLYGAYLVIRPAAPVEHRGMICAVVCILGMADVPLVYLSNRLFRTQHPSPVLGGGPDSGLAPPIAATLFFGMFTMMLLWWCVLLVRRRVARLERAAEDLTRRSHELEDLRSY
jgi:heme exporter protein C